MTIAIVPGKFEKLEKNLRNTQAKLAKQQNAAMKAVEKQQQDMLEVISKADSGFALQLRQQWEEHMAQIVHAKTPYVARLDTLTTLLKFISHHKGKIPQIGPLEDVLGDMKEKLAVCNALQNAAVQQRQLIGQWLQGRSGLDVGLAKQLKAYSLQLSVYKQQLEAWKTTLNDPVKLEQAMLAGLQKLPGFSKFLEQNNQLAAILGRGGLGSNPAGAGIPVPGMQSRQNLLQQLQQRFGNNATGTGSGVPQIIQQNLEDAMRSLSSLQQGIQQLEGYLGRGAIGNQNLTPQEKESAALKALPVHKRIRIGYNIQSGGGPNYFPAINDIGLKAGFQLHPRFEAGIGGAYKLGLGDSWRKIKISHEGVAIRSYADWRITPAGDKFLKGFWVTAGYEWNNFTRLAVSNSDTNNTASLPTGPVLWTNAGLLGVTKKIAKGKKEMHFQILWQFSTGNGPNASAPFLFRWGKSF